MATCTQSFIFIDKEIFEEAIFQMPLYKRQIKVHYLNTGKTANICSASVQIS